MISNPLATTSLDVAAAWFYWNGMGHVDWLLFASAPVYVHGALARCTGILTVAPEHPLVDQEIEQLLPERVSGLRCVRRLQARSRADWPVALWMLPQRSGWRTRLYELKQMGCPSSLVVLVPGTLAGLLGRHRPSWLAGQAAAAILPELSTLGYRMAANYGVGQIETVLWTVLARAAGGLHRPDVVDRCEAALRLTLSPPFAAHVAVMNCLMFRQTGRA